VLKKYKMAEGGSDYSELDPLIPKHDDDDKQEAEKTQPFQPAHWSTPHHRGGDIEMSILLKPLLAVNQYLL